MKIVVADKFPDRYISDLKSMGIDVLYDPKLTADNLAAAVTDATMLVVRSTKVPEKCIISGKELSLIIRAGAGVDNIDLQAASRLGIYVANCPGKNSIAVAELAMGLILALDRRIPDNVSDFRAGKWNKGLYSKADGIYGKKLGVIGTGKIGVELIHRARAFGMDIFAWSGSLSPERAEKLQVRYCENLQHLIDSCDIISIHVALNEKTRGLITGDLIKSMKPGTILINTSRAEVLDEDALIEAAESGIIRAGVDVFAGEPKQKEGEVKSRLQAVKNVYITHHIGASTEQAQNAVADEVVQIVREYVQKGRVRNWVNRCGHTEAGWQMVVRHYDIPGVLANVMNVLKKGNINAEEIDNVIFDGKFAACCTIQLDNRPTDEMLNEIRSRSDEVISATLINIKG